MTAESEPSSIPVRSELLHGSMDLLDYVTVVGGTEHDYGCNSVREFVQRLSRKIVNNRDRKHILVAGGEPDSGKTTILLDVLSKVLDSKGVIMRDAKRLGYTVVVDMIPWGDPYFAIPHFLRDELDIRDGKNYHELPKALEEKRTEIRIAEGLIEDTLAASIAENPQQREKNTDDREETSQKEQQKIIKIVVTDVPLITGEYSKGFDPITKIPPPNSTIGVPRGIALLQDLIHRRGKFENLEYNVSFVGVTASPDVRENNLTTRVAMLEGKTPEAKKKAMKERGLHVDTNDPEALEDYAKEVAPKDEIKLISDDVNIYLNQLVQNGILTINYPEQPQSPHFFEDMPSIRARTISEQVIPRIVHEVIGIPKRNEPTQNPHIQEDENDVLFVYNGIVLDKVNLHLGVPKNVVVRRPVKERYRRGSQYRQTGRTRSI